MTSSNPLQMRFETLAEHMWYEGGKERIRTQKEYMAHVHGPPPTLLLLFVGPELAPPPLLVGDFVETYRYDATQEPVPPLLHHYTYEAFWDMIEKERRTDEQ